MTQKQYFQKVFFVVSGTTTFLYCFTMRHQHPTLGVYKKLEKAVFTLKMGSKTSWQKVRGNFCPSGLLAVLLNLPALGSKYLEETKTSVHNVFK